MCERRDGMDHVILNRGHMTGNCTSAGTSLSKLTHHTSGRTFGLQLQICRAPGHIHGGSSVESGFEHGFPSADALPLGHRGPSKWSTFDKFSLLCRPYTNTVDHRIWTKSV
ncbi:hypothetical protein AVEN_35101-1 [Araneus ventricosus]|uniref:Uncharacterized protein n=1 Tax=Araneus ventricosus TaxID=182803 RepID=A0A4Y2I5N4_ARAVE|nr:hypothetical protein AVEN_35101-1 [Araneus ventricosus]